MMFLSSIMTILLFVVSSNHNVDAQEEHRNLRRNNNGRHNPNPPGTNCFGQSLDGSATRADLTQDQLNTLHYMRSEEQFARDIYSLFFEEYGLRVFQNIQRSEQRHLEAMQNLLTIQGEDFDPATFGTYPLASSDSDAIQQTWDSLTNGNKLADGAFDSVVDALKYGIEIEITDILDLQAAVSQLSGTDAPYIQHVYENQMRASENHLRAFVRTLEATGESFDTSSTAMDEDELEAILAAGGGRGYGGGNGGGGRGGRLGWINV